MLQVIEIVGERAGARTQDPVIKSHVLYRLSYALPWPLMASKRLPSCSDIREACLAATPKTDVAGKNRLFPDHAFGPRCVGGVAAEVNSAGGCRNSRQERGFARVIRSLRAEFQSDWRPVIHVELPEVWQARTSCARRETVRPVTSSRAGPRSAPAARCRRGSAARLGAGRSARRCGSRCRARTGTS